MQGQGRNFFDHDSASRHVHSFIPRENLAIQILSLCLAPCMLLSIVISSASGCLELFESGFYEFISFCISKRTRLSLQNSAKDHAPRGGRNCVETTRDTTTGLGLSPFPCIRRYPTRYYKGDVTVSTAKAI